MASPQEENMSEKQRKVSLGIVFLIIGIFLVFIALLLINNKYSAFEEICYICDRNGGFIRIDH